MDVHYGLLLKKSWNDLKKNLIVFLPLVFGLLFSLGFVLVVVLEVLLFVAAGLTFETNLIAFVAAVIFVGLIDLILMIYISAAINAMSIGLFNVVVTKKKATSEDMWFGMKRFTQPYFRVSMITLSIFLVPLLVVGLLVGLGFLINVGFGVVLAFLLGGLYLLYLIAAAIIIAFGFFFLGPIISTGKSNSAVVLIKQSLRYTKENLGHTVISWAIVFGINLAISTAYQLSTFPGSILPILFLVFLPVMIIFFIASIVISIWLKLFVFNSYFNPGLKKL